MARNLFDVDITDDVDEEEKLSERTRQALGYEKENNTEEGNMVAKERDEVERDVVFDYLDKEGAMKVDSPRDTWDALGHVSLQFDVRSYDEVMDVVSACGELWDEMADMAGIEEGQSDSDGNGEVDVTDRQMDFIEDLIDQLGRVPRGVDVPRDLTDLSKEEANSVIQDLLSIRDAEEDNRESRRSEQRRTPQRSSRRSGGRDDGDFGNLQGDVTPGQLDTIKDLADQLNERPPRGMRDMTKQEASDWISEAISDLN